MKKLIVCCDGTWNRPDQVEGSEGKATNVVKIARAIAATDRQGVFQHVYYDKGVGTGRWDHFRGGAFGAGLSENIRQAYLFLVEHYEQGDELFFFGFSRGAYTVRSLAGFIRNSGLLRRESLDRLDEAYALYRRRDDKSHPTSIEAELFRRSFGYESVGFEVRFKCLGVWDTVGALGIPIGLLGHLTGTLFHLQFHDVQLSSKVDNAFQALAIDERRLPFQPCLWNQQAHSVGQRMEQVWCAGVHSNVGGGYEETGLSDLAFLWIMERATECGLAFNVDYVRATIRPNVLGGLRNSRSAFYHLMAEYIRPVRWDDAAPTLETVHPSVRERLARDPAYRPPNLRGLS